MKTLDYEEAKSVVNVLCWKLKLPPCKLEWKNKAAGGKYTPTKQTITFGPNVHRKENIIHEVAHHFCYHKFGGSKFVNVNRSIHGSNFQTALLITVQTWYGNIKDYPWHTEYKRIANEFGRN